VTTSPFAVGSTISVLNVMRLHPFYPDASFQR
jgi:hypothetical protein